MVLEDYRVFIDHDCVIEIYYFAAFTEIYIKRKSQLIVFTYSSMIDSYEVMDVFSSADNGVAIVMELVLYDEFLSLEFYCFV